MKKEKQGSISRRLVFAVTIVLLALPSCHEVNNGQILIHTISTDSIVFEGTLEKLGPNPGIVSRILAVYRLARYRVNKVCEGKYEGTDIVVDHIIFDGKEFEGINVNDHVCVSVKIANHIADRDDIEGIRSRSEDVKIFYVAHGKIQKINPRGTCCHR